LVFRTVLSNVLKLSIRRCPNCWYVGPTRRFAEEGGRQYRCPRCCTEVEAPDPRLN
jgi:tRNA(Ile2) C34 agmatinyltransferase TiaS